ncbi:adenylate/guanylate cyclase domain-containing protein [Bowmanella dokdonensis]|uniref:Adenylate/guanylate cyclase domain-containing protein n=1 Tax=Bowmanella dokdonensis TaxID=751969 RepID=A0A939DMM6_9ALTE|nr:adenylate/guanylate cyclase domain-containing protein [Bowmanella dokdonensis]MBN7824576.1 adenylate/guanylate cyclase domain-containing protein [Bowmanella dokdonensis]
MISAFLRTWVWAGIRRDTLANVSPARLTNLISLLVFLVLLVHLPLHLAFWQQGGDLQALSLLFHALLCTLIPLCSALGYQIFARRLLLICFASYISLSSLYIGYGSAIHWYFIQGIFISPFLYSLDERWRLWLAMGMYLTLFLLLEYLALSPFIQPGSDYQQVIRQFTITGIALACIPCVYFIHRDHACSWSQVSRERLRSESLLLNILPRPIAERLKLSDKPVADYFANATVLFTDIEGFSGISCHRSPIELVTYLNALYSEFDRLLKLHRLEKIKTNGDEYMAVSGVPVASLDHAVRACQCALDMLKAFEKISHQHGIQNGLRIGLNSGELVAGVIGKNKFSYDLWGDSVNLASRMESQGQSNRIQVSEFTYRLCRHAFTFEPRGRIPIRGMGEYQVYWLKGEVASLTQAKSA